MEEPYIIVNSSQNLRLSNVRSIISYIDEVSDEVVTILSRIDRELKPYIESKDCVNNCPICISEESNADSFLMVCKHEFHNECLIKWLKINNTCPICRVVIG